MNRSMEVPFTRHRKRPFISWRCLKTDFCVPILGSNKSFESFWLVYFFDVNSGNGYRLNSLKIGLNMTSIDMTLTTYISIGT